jgi:hypothetical protein
MQKNYFDAHAATYDTDFSNTGIGIAQRNQVHQQIRRILNNNCHVLELNAGTGVDAIFISPLVFSLLCTDASEEMIKIIIKKIQSLNIQNVQASALSIQDISKIKSTRFNVIFSNFGGLNCLNENELKLLALDLYNLSEPSAKVCLVIMGKHCLWHNILRLFIPRFNHLKSRNSIRPISLNLSGTEVNTYFYSPKDIIQCMEKYFTVDSVTPIGFFVPPSYMNSFFERNKRWLHFLIILDHIAKHFSFLADYSDHFLIQFRRK